MITLAAAGTLAGVAGTATAVTMTVFGDEILAGADTFKKLYQGQLPNAAATLYTVPASTQGLIKSIFLVNTTASAVTVTLYVDGTAASNQVFAVTLPANGTATYDTNGWQILSSLGVLQVSSGGAGALKYSALFGDGVTTSFSFTHALGTQLIGAVLITRASDGEVVDADVLIPPAGTTVGVTFAAASVPASNAYRITVLA